jgi:catechol 2,3-dioxygenase-like lactoylglutathione lyase family enzyme/uncharacterized protein YndB with AHSA1/START domain
MHNPLAPRPATLGQIALNVYDLRVRDWYARVFGFVYAGATDLFFGPTATRVQGIPRVAERCKWLIDGKADFQLEFFKFLTPRSKPRRPDARLSDIGYQMMGIWARDFDAVVERLAREGQRPLSEPVGPMGSRCICVRDPEGNLVEIFERDPLAHLAPALIRPEVPATVRTITVSVPHLDRFKRTLVEVFDLEDVSDAPLHSAEHEKMWGLDGATRQSALLRANGALVELVQYERPEPRPWPDGYRICDQGYMNIAFVFGSVEDFDRYFTRAVAAGCRANGKPLDAGVFKVMYVNDPEGFSIELLYPRPWAYRLTGFVPSIPYIQEQLTIEASPERIWQVVREHERMKEWTGLDAELLRPGLHDRNGVGAVRKLGMLGRGAEEEIVEFVPNERYVYRLLRGAPIRNHEGTVMLIPEGSATRVRWAVRFEGAVPGSGSPLAAVLSRVFRSSLVRLKRLVES